MGPEDFPNLPLESRLLIQCARTCFLDSHADRAAKLVAEGIDWPLFLRQCKLHGVTPLVSRNLHAVNSTSIPSECLESLKNSSKANAIQAQFLTTELIELIEAFRAKEIIAVPFKGPTLAVSAYGSQHLREFGDLDLCVRNYDVPAARKILEARGYQVKSESSKEETDEEVQTRIYHTFINQNGMVHVDLQWIMAGSGFSFLLDQKIFWDELQEVEVAGRFITGFTPENILIILCVHGTKHVWESLKWICDVAELLIAHPQLNWDVVVSRSSSLQIRRIVFMGLYLAHWYFQAPIPRDLQQKLVTDSEIPSLARCIPNNLLQNPDHGVTERFSGGFYFLLKDSLLERWKYGFKLCQTVNPIFTTRLPWFRFQKRLQLMFWITFPLRMVARKIAGLLGLREPASRLVSSWLK